MIRKIIINSLTKPRKTKKLYLEVSSNNFGWSSQIETENLIKKHMITDIITLNKFVNETRYVLHYYIFN